MDILAPNGKPAKQIDPTMMGIEEVLDRQTSNRGRGVGMSNNDILTVIILELNRVKRLSINQSEIIRDQDEIIKELTGGRGAIATDEDKQQSIKNDRDQRNSDTDVTGTVTPISARIEGAKHSPN